MSTNWAVGVERVSVCEGPWYMLSGVLPSVMTTFCMPRLCRSCICKNDIIQQTGELYEVRVQDVA